MASIDKRSGKYRVRYRWRVVDSSSAWGSG